MLSFLFLGRKWFGLGKGGSEGAEGRNQGGASERGVAGVYVGFCARDGSVAPKVAEELRVDILVQRALCGQQGKHSSGTRAFRFLSWLPAPPCFPSPSLLSPPIQSEGSSQASWSLSCGFHNGGSQCRTEVYIGLV